MIAHLYTVMKAALIFIGMVSLTRVVGRKQLSELTYNDYCIRFIIGSIAATVIINPKVNVVDGILAILVLTVLPILIELLSIKSIFFERHMNGLPIIIIQNGSIVSKNMQKVRYTVNDMLKQLRQKDIFDITEVEFAILETDGKLSVLKRVQNLNITNKDLNIKPPYKGVMTEVIVSGAIINENLNKLNLDKKWLQDALLSQNIKNPKDVLLACVKENGDIYIDLGKTL
jgi:uncharacterized membrane protein YcaP (DUF421 family)